MLMCVHCVTNTAQMHSPHCHIHFITDIQGLT